MRGLTGYATLTEPVGSVKERDTFTCAHCNRVRHAEPYARGFLVLCSNGKYRQHEYVRCGNCDALICEQCVGKGCTPFEEQLKRMEARGALRRAVEEA